MQYQSKVELLAPVGSFEHLMAAVENGCDAVYLGGAAFNARQSAQNFSLEEIEEAIDYAHVRGVKVYITLNTLYKDSEIKQVLEFVKQVYMFGADALIVQDLGIASEIRKHFPDIQLHGSTQMTVHNIEGVRQLEEWGFSRVVLAREMTLPEIVNIIENTKMDIECFIHGALCICYSGQCLMSSVIGGRSGNRGRCAQPCRLPYSLVHSNADGITKETFIEQYLLSPKDLSTLQTLPELIKSGIHSFKIEGRLKRPEYAALVTRIYRKYIDLYYQDPEQYVVDPNDEDQLMQIFNRGGFTTGYFGGKQGKDMMSMVRPKNWGLKVGTVSFYNPKARICTIELEKELKSGDGIEIWTEKDPHVTGNINIIEQKGKSVQIKIEGSIQKGDAVYKTSDVNLINQIQNTYKNPKLIRRVDVYASITVKLNQPLELVLWDHDGNMVQKVGDAAPELSIKSSITEEKICNQIRKMGNTPYQCASIEVILDDGVSISISKINELRRQAVELLTVQRKNRYKRTAALIEEKNIPSELAESTPTQSKITVFCKNSTYIEQILDLDVDRVYIDYEDILDESFSGDIFDRAHSKNTELVAVLPRISRKAEMRRLVKAVENLEKTQIDGYLIGNLGQVSLLKSSNKKKFADFSLNVMNAHSIKVLEENGLTGVTLSPELTLKEIRKLSNKNNIEKEIIVYGYLPLMETEYCVLGGTSGRRGNEERCTNECKGNTYYGLLDRKGKTFPVISNGKTCTSLILNSQPLFVLQQIREIANTGCNLRLHFTLERKKEAVEMISAYKEFIQGQNSGKYNRLIEHMLANGFTKGHFYRGVE